MIQNNIDDFAVVLMQGKRLKIAMGQDSLTKYRRYVTISYVFMFLALFTVITAVISYFLARKVLQVESIEVWLHAQALWIVRNVLVFLMMAVFASLWFIPLCFFTWDANLIVKGTTVIGVIFAFMAWIYLLNAWLKGVAKFWRNKAVF